MFILISFLGVMGWSATARSERQTEIPFELRGGSIWIAVNVRHGNEPLNFLLDSGSQVSVIDQSTARRLHLRQGRQVDVLGVNSSVKGFWPEHLAANAAGVDLPANYLEVDLHELSRACDRTVDGLVGADFFRGRILQIDFSTRRIRLLGSARAGQHTDSLPLDVTSKSLRVPVRVNGNSEEWMRLDTGCASDLQWVTPSIPARCDRRQRAVGTGEISMPIGETSVQIGNTTFNRVLTGLQGHQIYQGEAGLLGNGLLCRFATVTIDGAAGRVFLDKAPSDSPMRQPPAGNLSEASLGSRPVLAAY